MNPQVPSQAHTGASAPCWSCRTRCPAPAPRCERLHGLPASAVPSPAALLRFPALRALSLVGPLNRTHSTCRRGCARCGSMTLMVSRHAV